MTSAESNLLGIIFIVLSMILGILLGVAYQVSTIASILKRTAQQRSQNGESE